MALFVITNSGCASKEQIKDSLSYETQVHKIQYQYVDCGDLKLNGLSVKLEDPDQHPGSKKNQEINTSNLIILDYKLKEAESLMRCYKAQTKNLESVITNYNDGLDNK